MGDNLKGIAVLAIGLHKLDEGKGLNRDQYPVLDNECTNPETWWDILSFNQKMDVGSVAIHFNKMSGNYRWNTESKFCDIKKSQQKIIKFVLAQKDTNYSMFPLQSMLKFTSL
jgi:hypothetical protein